MFSKDFIDFINDTIKLGHNGFLTDAMKLTAGFDATIKNKLDFTQKELFQEPLIFSHMLNTKKEITSEQLFAKYFLSQQVDIPVQSNKHGIIYLPKIGHLHTDQPNSKFIVSNKNGELDLRQNSREVSHKIYHSTYVTDQVEVPLCGIPYMSEVYGEEEIANFQEKSHALAREHMNKLIDAIELIKEHFGLYYEWFKTCICRIQILYNPNLFSFAFAKTYGLSVLSSLEERSIIFYLEDVIHQCAHNIFFASTYFEKHELFNCKPDAHLCDIFPIEDQREIYGVYHGLFTQSCISIFFDICLEKKAFNGVNELEIKARLSDNLKRWQKILEIFETNPEAFSALGKELINEFKLIYTRMMEKYADQIFHYDTSNQPYIFNFNKFLEANSIETNR